MFENIDMKRSNNIFDEIFDDNNNINNITIKKFKNDPLKNKLFKIVGIGLIILIIIKIILLSRN